MKRPVRPQTRQPSHTPGRVSGQRDNKAPPGAAEAFTGAAGTDPQLDDAGYVIESEPSSVTRARIRHRRYFR